MRWGMDVSGSFLLAGLLAIAACGSDAAPAARAPLVHAVGSSCADGSGFALSLASDRGGQPTPAAAAAWFARHGGLTGMPAQGWRQVSRSGSGATVESGAVTLHVIQDPTGHGRSTAATGAPDSPGTRRLAPGLPRG